jgi:hypothetical protein
MDEGTHLLAKIWRRRAPSRERERGTSTGCCGEKTHGEVSKAEIAVLDRVVRYFFPDGLVQHQQRIFEASRPSGPGRAVQVREPNMLTLYDSVRAGAGRHPFAQPNTA